MISTEVPILFAKASEIFIAEISMRSWVHAEENKRKTLQKSDVIRAIQKSDMYDFLIDIVPRDPAPLSTQVAYEGAEGGQAPPAQGYTEYGNNPNYVEGTGNYYPNPYEYWEYNNVP
jgi:hypothetical protein